MLGLNNRKSGHRQVPRINEQIRAHEIKLIDEAGQYHISYRTSEAIERAKSAGLSLVEIGYDKVKPLCKIMDYGKFQFQKSKQESSNRSKRGKAEKEIQISATTDRGDLERSIKQAELMLQQGHKVKVVLSFKGRTIAQKECYMRNMSYFLSQLEPVAKVIKEPTVEGKKSIAVLCPVAKSSVKQEKGDELEDEQAVQVVLPG